MGTGLAIPLGMALKDMLFEVGSVDPLTIASGATVLVGTAMAAKLDARLAASRMDPVEALREE